MAAMHSEIKSNAELVALPSGTVLLDSEDTIYRVVTTSLVEKPHIVLMTKMGLVERLPFSDLDLGVIYELPLVTVTDPSTN